MTTPWERITDDAYKSWLSERQIVDNEYNEVSLVERSTLRNQFEQKMKEQANEEQQQQKKQKTKNSFVAMLENIQTGEAERELLDAARTYMGDSHHDPKMHRHPPNTNDTWNKEAIGLSLKDIRNSFLPKSVADYSTENRVPVAIGLRLGSGFGKTHILTEAPALLGVSSGVYITYNHDQRLQVDREKTKEAALLRLILASHGCSSISCGNFFEASTTVRFFEAPIGRLEDLAVATFRKMAGDGDFVLAVDELAQLGTEAAKQVVSLLSLLCSHYYKVTGSICMVLVSSLNNAVFTTNSGRGIIDWVPDRATDKTIIFFGNKLPPQRRKHFIALAKSICGTHMRSIVICLNAMINGNTPSVKGMLNEMKSLMGVKFGDHHYSAIVNRVKDCMILKDLNPECGQEIEELIDKNGVMCPVFIQQAFVEKREESFEHLENLFLTFNEIHADGKDFEVAAMHFDLFRASLGVPVVPASAGIGLPTEKPGFSTEWYRKLKFPDEITLSTEDLLKYLPKKKEVVPSETKPTLGKYYHPATKGHPFIDRSYVAVHPTTGDYCLVLTQEKVNDDFGAACKALNMAASMLSQKWGFNKILLVVNVIGTNENTWAQHSLEWPHILVRNKKEVEAFYSVNFADLIWYARVSNLLKHSKKVEM